MQILDNDKALHFSLLRLQLVELIRSCNASGGNVVPALNFAREQLGPRAPTNPKFVEALEETMVLILFPSESLNPQSAALLKPDLRRVAADDVNKAILQSQSARREAAIRHLVRMRVWAESTARERGRSLPSNIDIGLRDEGVESRINPQLTGDNDGDSMVT
ncbi:hypothetical protein CDD82_7119 [Ophiocordyceps australis]|uniref:CTLH domain-containing protein n=1 Tax=Ophiocordyceps australis TaxID=1399860 RepID=A0A2C5YZM7_9HYPO|nr:hypothetical protein CDD82_7119 [Ophiocordyceps australis]